MEPLAGILVADFTRYLPGPFASRELLERGARVVRVETPEGDPLRDVAPGWDAALNAGKESVVWDREQDPDQCRRRTELPTEVRQHRDSDRIGKDVGEDRDADERDNDAAGTA